MTQDELHRQKLQAERNGELDNLMQSDSFSKLDAIPLTKNTEKEVQEFVIGKYLGERLEAEITKPISEKTVYALQLEMDFVLKQISTQERAKTIDCSLEKGRQLDNVHSDF